MIDQPMTRRETLKTATTIGINRLDRLR